jgi:hypothetical protein
LRQEFFVAAQLNRCGPFGVFDAVLDRHSGRTAHCQVTAHSTLLWAYCSTHFANRAPLDSDHSLKRRFFLSSPIVRSRLKSHDTRPSKGKNEIDTLLRLADGRFTLCRSPESARAISDGYLERLGHGPDRSRRRQRQSHAAKQRNKHQARDGNQLGGARWLQLSLKLSF